MFSSTVAAAALVGALLPAPAAALADVADRDATFLRVAHQTNLAEIAGGRLAAQKSPSPGVRALAARLVRDHMAMDAEVIRVAALVQVRLPDEPSKKQQALGARYEVTPPSLFDPLYVSTQAAGHATSLARARQAAVNAGDARVREVAAAAVPVIASHHEALDGVGYGHD
ncbi:hypothetical protein Aab01nite_04700 [Paractinoplanes abujensis]|uniref:Putative membrane protein n=1 Tax=Paractinoplanes abujensis TaxID=882441 RepID=A0A7W7CR10_9ACTN|nr:DUF4142 domain-containing protein [Actinoplanes abujensis]MBB4691698.1 putative membrane protein [Actinoplanes abujensis]GID16880.1 hypothetical protein Aab01nite_04700 [Actinoplanes abujensis]